MESKHLGLIPGMVCLESGRPRLPWTCPERTSGVCGVVRSIKEFSDENYSSCNDAGIGNVRCRHLRRPTDRTACRRQGRGNCGRQRRKC